MLVILAQASLECAICVLDLIKLHLQLQITFNLLLQKVIHRVALLFERRVSDCHFLVTHLLRDLFNVNVALRELYGQLVAQIIALTQHALLGLLDRMATLKHLIVMCHQSFQILRRQQHKVVIVSVHLIVADSILARKEVE